MAGQNHCSLKPDDEEDMTFLLPTPQERRHVANMITGGVLKAIEGDLLPKGGWVKVCCPDGDCTPEHIAFYRDLSARANRELVCTHLCIIRGGPAAIPFSSRIHEIRHAGELITTADKWVATQITDALAIKNAKGKEKRIRNLSLVAHCACGMMRAHNISVLQNLELSFLAKDWVRKHYPTEFDNTKVMLQFTHEEGKFRTYLVNRAAFVRFMRTAQSAHAA